MIQFHCNTDHRIVLAGFHGGDAWDTKHSKPIPMGLNRKGWLVQLQNHPRDVLFTWERPKLWVVGHGRAWHWSHHEINYDSIQVSSSHFQLGRYFTLQQTLRQGVWMETPSKRDTMAHVYSRSQGAIVSSNIWAKLDELPWVVRVTTQITCGSTSSLAAQRLSLVTPVEFFISRWWWK
jgi:hypothetical protein